MHLIWDLAAKFEEEVDYISKLIHRKKESKLKLSILFLKNIWIRVARLKDQVKECAGIEGLTQEEFIIIKSLKDC